MEEPCLTCPGVLFTNTRLRAQQVLPRYVFIKMGEDTANTLGRLLKASRVSEHVEWAKAGGYP